jgi:hypothetical protein
MALSVEAPLVPHPYLEKGVRIEVIAGPFRGLQGLIDRVKDDGRLVLQVDAFGQAVSLEIDRAVLESPARSWVRNFSRLSWNFPSSSPSAPLPPLPPAAPAAPAPPDRPADESDEDIPDLVIWHGMDKRLQSMQQVQADRDKNFSYLSIYRVAEKKFFRLADDDVRQVDPAPKHRFAIGQDYREYELDSNLDGQRYQDIYVIDHGKVRVRGGSLAFQQSYIYEFGVSAGGAGEFSLDSVLVTSSNQSWSMGAADSAQYTSATRSWDAISASTPARWWRIR